MRERITVSLPPAQVQAARAAVDRGDAQNVSDYVSQAIAHHEGDDKTWEDLVAEVYERTGGPPTPEEELFYTGLVDGSIDGMLTFEEWRDGRGHHA